MQNLQIRRLNFAIIHSTTLALPAWKRTCLTYKLTERLILRDVRTRWNSTFDMLLFAVKYRRAVDGITAEKSLKLRKFELDDQECKILSDLLTIYKAATLVFSKNSLSTIVNVIPTMDKIDELLTLQMIRTSTALP
ncbi:hypothetical protein DFH08DRAFT_709747 [Mycena albidolilacea]|uniref:Uncharacterized protein n=1 Tax=Mycena albidolilacea TaxID=1033008 RepID=A0AAD6ZLT9_9AGAR|nr:hypothetical protein DFH08DRAFT_709747 [Mycena albidolilacea]